VKKYVWRVGEKLYMERCPMCDLENWAPDVASGRCAWCGYVATVKDAIEEEARCGKDTHSV
jgi:predicted Zn-ribbon and HTH transcriptional regulator